MTTWTMPTIPRGWERTLTGGGIRAPRVEPFGPCGIRLAPVIADDHRGVIIVTEADVEVGGVHEPIQPEASGGFWHSGLVLTGGLANRGIPHLS